MVRRGMGVGQVRRRGSVAVGVDAGDGDRGGGTTACGRDERKIIISVGREMGPHGPFVVGESSCGAQKLLGVLLSASQARGTWGSSQRVLALVHPRTLKLEFFIKKWGVIVNIRVNYQKKLL